MAAGFSNNPIGTHTGKTMMLPELRLLLGAVPGRVEFADYRLATVEENALAKSTAANRRNTLMYLKQLYGLRPDIPVFVALRELWDVRFSDQPILALLCASARDILLVLWGVAASPELLSAVNDINKRIQFGRLAWTGREVMASIELPAFHITPDDIGFACLQLGSIADHFDGELQKRFGGKTMCSKPTCWWIISEERTAWRTSRASSRIRS